MGAVLSPARRVVAYARLMRPANVVTAHADILAGCALAGGAGLLAPFAWGPDLAALGWLLLATTGLYGGGVVLNDVFDAALDAHERPERPIPSGAASRAGAALWGGALLVLGVASAWQVSGLSAVLAVLIALAVLVYDAAAKHHALLGPLTMGGCRGGNLLLGVSAAPLALADWWFLAALPVVYVAAITAISQGEVHGGRRRTGRAAVGLLGLVLGGLLILGAFGRYEGWVALPFWLLFAGSVLPGFWKAARDPRPERIRAAVKTGVLALILLDATLAAGFGGWFMGGLVLALLPLSLGLARLFAVT